MKFIFIVLFFINAKDLGINLITDRELPNPQINLENQAQKPTENEYYMALVYYSNKAYNTTEIDESYIESYIAGNYLRNKIGDINRFKTKSFSNNEGFISKAVENELNEIFNQKRSSNHINRISNVSINNFYEIKIVKDGVPFLVQKDSFLKDKEVVITFDDGPVSQTQSQSLVDYLSQNDAKSIFFVLGSKLNQNTGGIIRNMSDKGHSVSIHGFYHATQNGKPFTSLSIDKAFDEILKTEKLIFDYSHKHPKFFRPPYGIIQPQIVSRLIYDKNIFPLGWTIDTLDWSIKSPDELFNRTTDLISKKRKGIILLHDIHPQSREVAQRLVLWLKQNNYKIISPDELASVVKKED